MIRTEIERVAKAARSFFSYGRWVRCGGLSEPLTGLAAASWLRSRLGEVSYPKNHTPSDLASLGHLPQRGRQGCGVDGRTANSRPYGVRGIIGSTEVESVGRRGQDCSPTGGGGGRAGDQTLPYSCGSQDRTTPQSAALTALPRGAPADSQWPSLRDTQEHKERVCCLSATDP